MKFGKEFSSQMVSEWQQAYMDYGFLKTLLKEIIRFKHRTNNAHPRGATKNDDGVFNRKMSLHRAFSGLVLTPGRQRRVSTHDVEEGIQLTKAKSTTSGPILVNATSSHRYETTFLMAAEEGGEYELVFFRRLDDEFNKVQKFYKEKVDEVMKEAAMLNKQMDALIVFRVKVENPDGWRWEERTVEITRLASHIATSAAALSASSPAGAKSIRKQEHMEAIREGGSSRAGLMEDDEDEEDDNGISVVSTGATDDVNTTSRLRAARPAPIDVLDRVKINNTKETPRSTIKGVLKVSKQTELKFSRDNLMKVEERLKRAFIEFYQKLRLLKSYSFF